MVTQPQINKLMEALSEITHSRYPDLDQMFHSETGRKYVRIFKDSSCWAFIELETGNVFMPASYKAPAKHARGNIFKFLETGNLHDAGFNPKTGYIYYLR